MRVILINFEQEFVPVDESSALCTRVADDSSRAIVFNNMERVYESE